jgi:hypothetical protein
MLAKNDEAVMPEREMGGNGSMSEHLDEGTVHAWLDGQLAPDESARIEAHVAACETCSALVAEARGFIAASSRIVSALDGVPARVVPARRRGPNIWQLRVAAAVVVMALGTMVVLRERGPLATPALWQRGAKDAMEARRSVLPPAPAPPSAVASAPPALRQEVDSTAADASAALAKRSTDAPTTREANARDRKQVVGKPEAWQSELKSAIPAAPGVSGGVSGGASAGVSAGAAGVPSQESANPARAATLSGTQVARARGVVASGNAPAAPPAVGVVAPQSAASAAAPPAAYAPAAPQDASSAASDQTANSVRQNSAQNAAKLSAQDHVSIAPAAAAPQPALARTAPASSGKPAVLDLTPQAIPISSACTGLVVTVAMNGTDSATVRLDAASVQAGPSVAQSQRAPSGNAPLSGSWAPLGADSAVINITAPDGLVSRRISCGQQ